MTFTLVNLLERESCSYWWDGQVVNSNALLFSGLRLYITSIYSYLSLRILRRNTFPSRLFLNST